MKMLGHGTQQEERAIGRYPTRRTSDWPLPRLMQLQGL
ncbi:hypothetical protein GMES_1341 [Paraglaciecola mesophila KMM 241]|uniref:Uncharacterized protein n=1 Tax=Paraglaciecola mesophila KMM 241 TaxID=1128912 RepID=K6ZJT0_9ALTE|nr:hypothetical protein GMES_1341 [Paraglaciecola mesophila KMM 241]